MDIEKIRNDLRNSPSKLGIEAEYWNNRLVTKYLRDYGVIIPNHNKKYHIYRFLRKNKIFHYKETPEIKKIPTCNEVNHDRHLAIITLRCNGQGYFTVEKLMSVFGLSRSTINDILKGTKV